MSTQHNRKFFGTDGIRGKTGTYPITPEFMLKLGWALGKILSGSSSPKVVVGKDTRISGYMFESAFESGFSAAGVDTYLIGPLPTPAIAFLTRKLKAQAGIVISASHNPYYDNGIKFFSAEGRKLSDEMELAIEAQLNFPLEIVAISQLGKAHRVPDAHQHYSKFCKDTLPASFTLADFKIILDCAHGATYQIAPQIFSELGAEIREISSQPNGLNINDHCGSTYPQNLKKNIQENPGFIGIAFDGDGDRLIMVDELGEILDGDDLLYILAKSITQTDPSFKGVVGTIMSNLGLEKALHALKLEFIRTDVGDRYVSETLVNSGWTLGGEPSGHLIYTPITLIGDGIIIALQILKAMKDNHCSLHDLKKGLVKLPQTLVNIRTSLTLDALLNVASIKKAIETAEASLAGNGRMLLRASGTEPLIRIMVEGENSQQIKNVAQSVADAITVFIS